MFKSRKRWFWMILAFFVLSRWPALADVRENLTKAFSLAFANPQAFKSTRMFEVLGYTPEQVKQMVEVTPRPATLSVEVTGDWDNGKFENIRVCAAQVKYYNLTIHDAVFEFPKVEVDLPSLEKGILLFKTLPMVKIETNVSENDILHVFDLFAKARNLSDLRLTISDKQTILKGKTRKGILTVAFQVFGQPNLRDSKRITFDCRKMVLNGLSVPRAGIKALFDHINPVFDAGQTWLNLDLEKITTGKGFVRSFGTIRPAKDMTGKAG